MSTPSRLRHFITVYWLAPLLLPLIISLLPEEYQRTTINAQIAAFRAQSEVTRVSAETVLLANAAPTITSAKSTSAKPAPVSNQQQSTQ